MPPRRSSRIAAKATAATSVPTTVALPRTKASKARTVPIKRQKKDKKEPKVKVGEEQVPLGWEETGSKEQCGGTEGVKRTAASQFWGTEELRAVVLGLVDRRTLVGMKTLERRSLASVAKVLYNRVHISQAMRLNRKTPRSRLYCDLVRTLDRNPLPIDVIEAERERSQSRWEPLPEVKAVVLNPKQLLKSVATWRKKFHDLRQILNDHPAKTVDSSYILKVNGRITSIHIETKAELNIDIHESPPSSSAAISLLPSRPILPGFSVHHTIRLDVKAGGRSYHELAPRNMASRWKEWLISHDLDRRVTGIHRTNSVRFGIPMTCEDVQRLLCNRRKQGYEPIRTSTIEGSHSISEFRDIISLLGPHLLSLRIEPGIGDMADRWSEIICFLDQQLPLLEQLEMSIDHRYTSPLPPAEFEGLLPNLRVFRFSSIRRRYPAWLICYLSNMGSPQCAYAPEGLCGVEYRDVGNLIKRLKLSNPLYEYLKSIDLFTLDVLDMKGMVHLFAGMPPGDHRPRRAAWNLIEDLQASLGEHSHLCEGMEEWIGAEAGLAEAQRCCSEVLKDLADAQGMVDAEDSALRRHFEELRATWGHGDPAYKTVGFIHGDLREKALGMMSYAERWLQEHNERTGGSNRGRSYWLDITRSHVRSEADIIEID